MSELEPAPEPIDIAEFMPNRSASIAKLAAALAKAQGEIEGASKDKTNPHFKSAYADLASVWEACREPLSKNELAVIQTPSAEGTKVTVETLLAHSSGEWITDSLTMTAQQATPQAIGSCITYARRYALSAMVGVAPEDDDGNEASGKPSGTERRERPSVVATPQPDAAKGPLPEGSARITACDANGSKPWAATVEWDDDAPRQVQIWAESVRDLARDCAQDGSPVVPTINRQGQLTKLTRWKPPVADETPQPLTAADVGF